MSSDILHSLQRQVRYNATRVVGVFINFGERRPMSGRGLS
jgi:hypothetical protein